jgi:hypothetical protein
MTPADESDALASPFVAVAADYQARMTELTEAPSQLPASANCTSEEQQVATLCFDFVTGYPDAEKLILQSSTEQYIESATAILQLTSTGVCNTGIESSGICSSQRSSSPMSISSWPETCLCKTDSVGCMTTSRRGSITVVRVEVISIATEQHDRSPGERALRPAQQLCSSVSSNTGNSRSPSRPQAVHRFRRC